MHIGARWRHGWSGRSSLSGRILGAESPPTHVIEVVLAGSASTTRPITIPLASLRSLCLWADRRVCIDSGTPATNEIQTLSISEPMPTTGSVAIAYTAGNTGMIPYIATAAQVQSAYEAASWISPGDVSCTGGPLPTTPVAIEFVNTLAGTNIAASTPPHLYTGFWDGGNAVVATTQDGGPGSVVDSLILNCGVPLVWDSTTGRPCPFTADISSLTIINLSSVNARVRLYFAME